MNQKRRCLPIWALVFLLAPALQVQGGTRMSLVSANRSEADRASKARWSEAYGKLPLAFEVNRGQTDKRVKFLSRGSGYRLFLTSEEAVLALEEPPARSVMIEKREKRLESVLRMKLVGANPAPQVTGLEELPGKVNYFIGGDPRRWRTNVPAYAKVKYMGVYPGVDLVYYGNQRQLEYDFVVAPGADPKAIQLSFQGAEKIEQNARGDLLLEARGGKLNLRKPFVYQEVEGVKREVSSGYVLSGGQRVAFQVATYDRTKSLVIDPVLTYSTYLGGSSSELGFSVAAAAGNAYVVGMTGSADFPLESPLDSSLSGSSDAFVTRLSADGSALVYSTYLGGGGGEEGRGIALDASGEIYVTGLTNSGDFPVVNAYDPTYNGDLDVFFSKLDASGSALLYSTYLGGDSFNVGYDVAVDTSTPVNAYVTGTTLGVYPTTPGAYQATFPPCGAYKGFVSKLNPSASGAASLVYSTYLGPGCGEHARGIAVDNSGNAYVTGLAGVGFPTTKGAFESTAPGGSDAYVMKLNPAGSALAYSTYLGGSSDDEAWWGIAVNGAGEAYVTGQAGPGFPTTSDAYQTEYAGGSTDAFVTRLNATGSALIYSTYLGGTGGENGFAIALDGFGNAHVTGLTNSTNFPTLDAFQPANGGGFDAFVTKVNATGSALVYSTYLGGAGGGFGSEQGHGIAVDPFGYAYVTGFTDSGDFPLAVPYDGVLDGPTDAFVVRIFDPTADLAVTKTDSPDPVTVGTDLTYTVTVTNAGPFEATGVTLTDTLPAGVTFVSATPSQGTCSEADGVVTCDLGTVLCPGIFLTCGCPFIGGCPVTVTIVVTPTEVGTVTNTATVVANAYDPNDANNTATETTTVIP